ncbi:MAG: UDP-3-O-(3-hydroxymyristoyl)glucosamine N-acyltransferase [Candidatus Neomarinimicrobiota bacterium]|nr:MAG: UDP-3-O-(3-hydroxymyristoyl)glucosamine N-acyltransferase [Candidatus Neomarinimicrobiota bacterium]
MFTLAELAALVQGEVVGNGELPIHGVSEIQHGTAGTITFLANPKYRRFLAQTKASAVIVNRRELLQDRPGIVVENPQLAIAKVLGALQPPRRRPRGIHPTAIVHDEAVLGQDVAVGPYVTIGPGSEIEDGCTLLDHVTIAENCRVGSGSWLHPFVTLYPQTTLGHHCIIHAGTVIGSDGFGYVTDREVHHKIPQNGGVRLGDRVEVGANCTIDRGTIGDTVIGADTKLDNLVHVAHNVTLGRGCLVTAQVAFAGSVRVGDFCIFAGQSGVAPHLKIGERAVIAAKSGVTKSLEGGKTYAGMPAREIREQNRRDALPTQMELFRKRLEAVEAKLSKE